ncbi:MAG: hypothetical protein ILP02_00285, partial [Clostridia bacterium]|nr:hypothetical protein [Clostridia bacterium]
GTAQVIKKHSTVGFVVTCDGSFTDIERSAYERAEERVVNELKSLNKPFIVLFNTVDPTADKVVSTCRDLEKKYGVATVPVNAAKLDKKTVSELFERLLFEFPIRVLGVDFPKWLRALEKGDGIIAREIDKVMEAASGIKKMSDYKKVEKYLTDGAFSGVSGISADMATGGVTISFSVRPELYYEVISKELGDSVCDEYSLLCYMRRLKAAKDGYDRISSALEKCAATGYGIASATMENADIGKPKVVKRGGQYCVRMDVAAKSLHIIGADVHEEVEVVSGTKQQCEEFAAGLESDEGAGLDTKVFGRTVTSMLEESVSKKSSYLSENVQSKLKRTVNKAVNEKKSNLICLLI